MFKKIVNTKGQKGFTLIEILFVVIVIAILAAIAIMRITTTTATARANSCKADQAVINTQVEQFMLDTGNYPADDTAFRSLLNNITYFPGGSPNCPEGNSDNYTYNTTTYRMICNTSGH